MILKEKMKWTKNGLNECVAKVIVHKEQLDAAVENIKTHETLIEGSLMPPQSPLMQNCYL